ncbi:MAG: toll/interleukin-1 receptor domain-containing protein [Gammaproteobacteria bacterium]|nr:toll/interleukin-1 receptor domain-containing protein [Gammaproteobacteria bacterium]
MKVFLSYSSKQRALAEQICLELEHSDHSVFFDKKSLRAGGNFRKNIRKELDQSEILVFLISPDSVAPKSYARSELDIAREKWPQPEAHVLPVMAVETSLKKIPPYLKAVKILDPEGEIVEAVSRCLDEWSPMEEVDPVEEARKQLEKSGAPTGVAGLIALGTAIGAFEVEVLESGKPNKVYKRKIKGIVKGYGKTARFVPEPTDYTASAGREYKDDYGRTCRDVTLSFKREGEWTSQSDTFYLQRGKWARQEPE